MHVHHAGVSKKSKRGRKAVASYKARRRLDRALDRAAVVVERTARKMQRSKGQARAMHLRKKTWDEINLDVAGDAAASKTRPRDAEQTAVDDFFDEDTDEDMEEEKDGEKGEAEEEEEAVAAAAMAAAVPAVVPLPPPGDDDDDIR